MMMPTLHTLSSTLSFRSLELNFGQGALDNNLPGASRAIISNPNAGFGALIAQILNIVLVFGVVAVFFFLILGAIEWITSGGDSGKTQKAREKITQAVIGLVVLISVVAIMMLIQNLLDICIINFSNTCQTV